FLSTLLPFFCYLQFCHSQGHHIVLHSFPTRRSSDLAFPHDASPCLVKCQIVPSSNQRCTATATGIGSLSSALRASACSTYAVARSEEHTSELQSRENLVCRLLLEKKKNNHTQTH